MLLEEELLKYVKLVKRNLAQKKPAGTPGMVEHTGNLSTEVGEFFS